MPVFVVRVAMMMAMVMGNLDFALTIDINDGYVELASLVESSVGGLKMRSGFSLCVYGNVSRHKRPGSYHHSKL